MGSSHKKKQRRRSVGNADGAAPETLESRAEISRTPRRNLVNEFSKPETPASKVVASDGSPTKRDRPSTGGKTVLISKSLPGPMKAIRTVEDSESDIDPFGDLDAVAKFHPLVPRGTKRKKRQATPAASDASEEPDPASKYLTKPTDFKNLGTVRVAPCSNCVRGIVNESFISHAHRCWNLKHETRPGVVNKLCSECSRKHLKFCESVSVMARFVNLY
jgi:hypothetical protein